MSEKGRIRVGVIGLGLIAQVAHLPNLHLLRERFEVSALCDLSEAALTFGRELFPRALTTSDWRELVGGELDAVLVLTPGSHAPIAVEAARRGLHVFVEKPLCFSVEEGHEIIAAARQAGTVLMVGYTKRYDPAYEALVEHVQNWRQPIRLIRVTTLEAPWQPYAAYHQRAASTDVPADIVVELAAEDERRVEAAVATNDPILRRAYRYWLLDSMVHEFNAVRGLVGEPTELRSSDVWGDAVGVTVTLAFGKETECVVMWVDLPGLARYEMEIGLFTADRRAVLAFPSPYLRQTATKLVLEGGEPGDIATWHTEHTVSYESAFMRELQEFHEAVTSGRSPRTPAEDGLRDVALCQAVIGSIVHGRPVPNPTAFEQHRANG